MNVLLTILLILAIVFVLLFTIYFFNLDMKLMVNVIVPFLEKHYDKIERDQYL
ncbi:MAG: hypothetical protein HUJ70_15645 [Pseudobutyrivibrio sp.]|nr:hypothetical protein [Pseudobutyrivibrio sp.]